VSEMRVERAAIVVGANGAIGNAMLERFERDTSLDKVFAISRTARRSSAAVSASNSKVIWLESDASENSIGKVCKHIKQHGCALTHIVIATGKLHDEAKSVAPEKRIDSLAYDSLAEVFSINTFLPMLWLSKFAGLLNRNQKTVISVLSARVGSIADNQLGGWYTYRGSKAALNMMLKTLAIEFQRRYPLVKLIAFHPGTTNSKLSEPFQANVPPEKLFTPEFVAQQLWTLMNSAPVDGQLSYQDWQHQDIAW